MIVEPGRLHAASITGKPVVKDGGVGKAAEKGDALVAKPGQMLDRRHHARPVVGDDGRDFGAGQVPNDDHHGNSSRDERLEVGGIGGAGRRDDETGNAVLTHRGDNLTLPVDALAGVRQELHEAGRLDDHIDADRQLGKEAVRQVVHNNADNLRFGTGLAKIGCAAIIDIAEFAHHGIDLGARPLIDQRGALQHQRHRRLGNAGGLCDVNDGHPRFCHFPLRPRRRLMDKYLERSNYVKGNLGIRYEFIYFY